MVYNNKKGGKILYRTTGEYYVLFKILGAQQIADPDIGVQFPPRANKYAQTI